MVPDLAGRRRLDVHRLHSEPVRHLAGPLRGSDASGHLSQHHVNEARQNAGRWRVDSVVCNLLSAADWRQK